MYTIIRAGEGELEAKVRRVVANRHRRGLSLPEYFLAPELAEGPPALIDGFLVMGTQLVALGELCLVTLVGRPGVRDERR